MEARRMMDKLQAKDLEDKIEEWRNECMNLRAQLAEALVTTRGEMHACDYQELLVLKAQLVAKDAVICGMREAQIKVRQQLSLSFTPEDRNKWLAFVDEVFVAHLTCPHKEKILNQFEDMCVRRGIRPEFAIAAIREQKEDQSGKRKCKT